MAEYIDKQRLIDWLREEEKAAAEAFEKDGGESGAFAEVFHGIADELSAFPAADVAPVVHGGWIPISDGDCAECSECGECYDTGYGGMTSFRLFLRFYKLCPSCGARMDEEE